MDEDVVAGASADNVELALSAKLINSLEDIGKGMRLELASLVEKLQNEQSISGQCVAMKDSVESMKQGIGLIKSICDSSSNLLEAKALANAAMESISTLSRLVEMSLPQVEITEEAIARQTPPIPYDDVPPPYQAVTMQTGIPLSRPEKEWPKVADEMQLRMSDAIKCGLLTVHKALVNDGKYIADIHDIKKDETSRRSIKAAAKSKDNAHLQKWLDNNGIKTEEKADNTSLLQAMKAGYMLSMLNNDLSTNDFEGKKWSLTTAESDLIKSLQKNSTTVLLSNGPSSQTSGQHDRDTRLLVMDPENKLRAIFQRKYGKSLAQILQTDKVLNRHNKEVNVRHMKFGEANVDFGVNMKKPKIVFDGMNAELKGNGYSISFKVKDPNAKKIQELSTVLPYSLNATQIEITEQQNAVAVADRDSTIASITRWTAPTGSGKTFNVAQALKAADSTDRMHLIATTQNARAALVGQLKHIKPVVCFDKYQGVKAMSMSDRQILDEIKQHLMDSDLGVQQKLQISLLRDSGNAQDQMADGGLISQIANIQTVDPAIDLMKRCANSPELSKFLPDINLLSGQNLENSIKNGYNSFIRGVWDNCLRDSKVKESYVSYSVAHDKPDVALILSPEDARTKNTQALKEFNTLSTQESDPIEVLQFLQTHVNPLKMSWDEYHESAKKDIDVLTSPASLAKKLANTKFKIKGIDQPLLAEEVITYFKMPKNYTLDTMRSSGLIVADEEYKNLPNLKRVFNSLYAEDREKQSNLFALMKDCGSMSKKRGIDIILATATPLEAMGQVVNDGISTVSTVDIADQRMDISVVQEALENTTGDNITINKKVISRKSVEEELAKSRAIILKDNEGQDVKFALKSDVHIALSSTIFGADGAGANRRIVTVNKQMPAGYNDPSSELIVSFLGINGALDDLSVGDLEPLTSSEGDAKQNAIDNFGQMIKRASDLRSNLLIFGDSGALGESQEVLKNLLDGKEPGKAGKAVLQKVAKHNERWMDEQLDIVLGVKPIPITTIARLSADRIAALEQKGWIEKRDDTYRHTANYCQERLGWTPDLSQAAERSSAVIAFKDQSISQLSVGKDRHSIIMRPNASDINTHFQNVRDNVALFKIVQEVAAAVGVSKEQLLHNLQVFDHDVGKNGSVIREFFETHQWDLGKVMHLLGVNNYSDIVDKAAGTSITDKLWQDISSTDSECDVIKKAYQDIVAELIKSPAGPIDNPMSKIQAVFQGKSLLAVQGQDALLDDGYKQSFGTVPCHVTYRGSTGVDDPTRGAVATVNKLHNEALHNNATAVGNVLGKQGQVKTQDIVDDVSAIATWRNADVSDEDITFYAGNDTDLKKRLQAAKESSELSKKDFFLTMLNLSTQRCGRPLRVADRVSSLFASNPIATPNILAEVMSGLVVFNPDNSLCNPDGKAIEQSLSSLYDSAGQCFAQYGKDAEKLVDIMAFLNNPDFSSALQKKQFQNPGTVNYNAVLDFVTQNVDLIQKINNDVTNTQQRYDIADIILDNKQRSNLSKSLLGINISGSRDIYSDIANGAKDGANYISAASLKMAGVKLTNDQQLHLVALAQKNGANRDVITAFVQRFRSASPNDVVARVFIDALLEKGPDGKSADDDVTVVLNEGVIDIAALVMNNRKILGDRESVIPKDDLIRLGKLSHNAREKLKSSLEWIANNFVGKRNPELLQQDYRNMTNNLMSTLHREDINYMLESKIPSNHVPYLAVLANPVDNIGFLEGKNWLPKEIESFLSTLSASRIPTIMDKLSDAHLVHFARPSEIHKTLPENTRLAFMAKERQETDNKKHNKALLDAMIERKLDSAKISDAIDQVLVDTERMDLVKRSFALRGDPDSIAGIIAAYELYPFKEKDLDVKSVNALNSGKFIQMANELYSAMQNDGGIIKNDKIDSLDRNQRGEISFSHNQKKVPAKLQQWAEAYCNILRKDKDISQDQSILLVNKLLAACCSEHLAGRVGVAERLLHSPDDGKLLGKLVSREAPIARPRIAGAILQRSPSTRFTNTMEQPRGVPTHNPRFTHSQQKGNVLKPQVPPSTTFGGHVAQWNKQNSARSTTSPRGKA